MNTPLRNLLEQLRTLTAGRPVRYSVRIVEHLADYDTESVWRVDVLLGQTGERRYWITASVSDTREDAVRRASEDGLKTVFLAWENSVAPARVLGTKLGARRQELGMSVQELAESCAVPAALYVRWEEGLGMPSVLQLVTLAAKLKVSMATLVENLP